MLCQEHGSGPLISSSFRYRASFARACEKNRFWGPGRANFTLMGLGMGFGMGLSMGLGMGLDMGVGMRFGMGFNIGFGMGLI